VAHGFRLDLRVLLAHIPDPSLSIIIDSLHTYASVWPHWTKYCAQLTTPLNWNTLTETDFRTHFANFSTHLTTIFTRVNSFNKYLNGLKQIYNCRFSDWTKRLTGTLRTRLDLPHTPRLDGQEHDTLVSYIRTLSLTDPISQRLRTILTLRLHLGIRSADIYAIDASSIHITSTYISFHFFSNLLKATANRTRQSIITPATSPTYYIYDHNSPLTPYTTLKTYFIATSDIRSSHIQHCNTQHIQPNGAIFCLPTTNKPTPKPFSIKSISKACKQALVACNIPESQHKLKHITVSYWIEYQIHDADTISRLTNTTRETIDKHYNRANIHVTPATPTIPPNRQHNNTH